MRIFYFSLFLLLTFTLTAQEPADFLNGRKLGTSEVKLYPNPTFGGVVNILTQANADKEITVYDVFGEVVLKDQINGKTLDVSRLAPGVYVLQISEGQQTITRKLVVK
ncbi:hypothetical protein LCGC14_0650910 [marine sediment metagenome]|uniref:T9SS type A sorting domain-containing protein n=2 Tax=root TaxID=1 RepID=A0A831QKX1_9FLAO|nr:T9SS type A sorting domain-containing protein [Pricia sp.]HEA20330.1 T9SS type A sorting domain-containing protein [Pricia antarctica]